MSLGNKLGIVAIVTALGGLIVPAFAQNVSSDMQGGMMSHGMMAGGCSQMMQSMNNRDGRPNSQWQKHSSDGSDNGG
jgi:hypothetical protein